MNGSNSKVEFQVACHGKPVKEYGADGRVLVEGRVGESFTIKLRNHEPRRFKAVVAVDGINVISGQPSSTPLTEQGYVIPAFGMVEIDGWRTSNSEVAQFVFTERGKSYAATQMATVDGCGVIGVAFVAEPTPEPIKVVERVTEHHHHHNPWVQPQPWLYQPCRPWWYGDVATCNTTGVTTTGVFRAGGVIATNCSVAANAPETPLNLGTGWGESQASVVAQVEFASYAVVELLSLYYTSVDGLKVLGIDVKKAAAVTFPPAFGGYCKPPKCMA